MARKTLERLTFDYLRAFSYADDTRKTHAMLPTTENRLAMIHAEHRFDIAGAHLQTAIGDMPMSKYICGLRDLTHSLVQYAHPEPTQKKRRRQKGFGVAYDTSRGEQLGDEAQGQGLIGSSDRHKDC